MQQKPLTEIDKGKFTEIQIGNMQKTVVVKRNQKVYKKSTRFSQSIINILNNPK